MKNNKRSLFTDDELYTPDAIALDTKTFNTLRHIFDDFVSTKQYKATEVAAVMCTAVNNLVLEHIIAHERKEDDAKSR